MILWKVLCKNNISSQNCDRGSHLTTLDILKDLYSGKQTLSAQKTSCPGRSNVVEMKQLSVVLYVMTVI